jgi:hypothetical protein
MHITYHIVIALHWPTYCHIKYCPSYYIMCIQDTITVLHNVGIFLPNFKAYPEDCNFTTDNESHSDKLRWDKWKINEWFWNWWCCNNNWGCNGLGTKIAQYTHNLVAVHRLTYRLHLSVLKSVKILPFLGVTADSALISVYNFTVR